MNESMAGRLCPQCDHILPVDLYEVAGIAQCPQCNGLLHWDGGVLGIMSEAEVDQLDRSVRRTIANTIASARLAGWLNDDTGAGRAPQVTIYTEPKKH